MTAQHQSRGLIVGTFDFADGDLTIMLGTLYRKQMQNESTCISITKAQETSPLNFFLQWSWFC